MTLRHVIAALLWVAGAVGHAVAGTQPAVGDDASGHIEMFGKRLPLPPGEWRVVATGFAEVTGGDPGAYGTIGTVTLIPVGVEQPLVFMVLRTNALPVRDGWGPPPECTKENVLLRSVAEPRDLQNACTFVVAARSGRIAGWTGDPALTGLLPPWSLVAGFRVSDRSDVVEVRYGIVPQSMARGDWFDASQALDSGQIALLRRLGEWAWQAREASRLALRVPADQVPAIPPLSFTAPVPAAAGDEEVAALRSQLYQLATDRAPATAWSWALASALAGNVYVGATVAAWQSLTHSALGFGNEMAWEWSRNAQPMVFATTRVAPDVSRAGDPGPDGFTFNGKRVPLPSGAWSVLAEDAGSAVLGLLDRNDLAGVVIAHTNSTPRTEIFAAPSDCSRRDVYFSAIRYDTPADGYCSYGKPVVPDDGITADPVWAHARQRLRAAGVSLPSIWLEVGARARTRENFLDVRYYFPPDPDLRGLPFGADRVAVTPPVLDQVSGLQAWADLVQLPLEQGVRGRLLGRLATLPWPWPADPVQAALARQAHAPLERLHAAGALDDAELQRQLGLADAAAAEREQQRWSLSARSTYKVATYRVLSYFDAVAVSWIVTTSPEQSLAYASINAVAQPVMTYLRQNGWVGSDTSQAPFPLQPVDFPEIGNDRF